MLGLKSFKKQFESEELAQKTLELSYIHAGKYAVYIGIIIAVLELLMIIRVLAVGMGNPIREKHYLLCYIFLFVLSLVGSFLAAKYRKDISKNGHKLYVIQELFILGISLWAVAITLLDGAFSNRFDVVVYMTITLIIPLICYVNPKLIGLVKILSDLFLLGVIIAKGYHGLAINFGVYVITSFYAGISFFRAKKSMYVSQCKLMERVERDDLTGIYNRQKLHEDADRVWEFCLENKKPLSFIMLDLDHFKRINDNHGHQVGDYFIKKFAMVLENSCADADCNCYRYGGEEFVLLLQDKDSGQAVELAKQLMARIEEAFRDNSYGIKVTASLGIYTGIPTIEDSIDHYLTMADELMYQSKENGRNQYTINK